MYGWWRRLRLLLWKNLLLQRRHKLQTLVEVITPLLFSIIMVVLQSAIVVTVYSTPTVYLPVSVDRLPDTSSQGSGLTDQLGQLGLSGVSSVLKMLQQSSSKRPNSLVGFTPLDNVTRQVITSVSRRLSPVQVKGFSTEEEMVRWLESADPDFDFTGRKLAGVVFDRRPVGTPDFGHNISITIRSRPADPDGSFLESATWYTNLKYPPFQLPWPRNKLSNVGGPPDYLNSGLLALQHALTAAIVQLETGSMLNISTSVCRMPYRAYTFDPFLSVLKLWLPRVVAFSFIFPMMNLVRSLVVEKERRLKESMRMMGLPGWLHWTAWFIKSFGMLSVTVVLLTTLFSVQWSLDDSSSHAILPYSSWCMVLSFFLLYAVSSIAFAFMISTCFSKASSSSLWSGVIFIITYLPYDVLNMFYDAISMPQKLLLCLLNNSAFGYGSMLIAKWEGLGDGMQIWNLRHSTSEDDSLTLLHVYVMLVVDTLLYLFMAWYFESVFPGECGVPQPWYFFCTKRYWRGLTDVERRRTYTTDGRVWTPSDPSEYFEVEPHNLRPGITAADLTKVYGNGKIAVDKINFRMYEGQISALLGHNGAGKTTTISMLVGLYPPSGGTASVNGHDILLDMDRVRTSLGICPQHNVLFDELTVAEHIRFFCALKGFSGDCDAEVTQMLRTLNLQDKRHALSSTLSGGMKRKLSVGIALCGGSKVVLLDEPTSGMDPSARRAIWDLLQREREGRTLLLTTHSMDEADLLGDRIFIMANGQLQCGGSSLFLKNKYGAGYNLTIVKQPDCDVQKITDFIKTFLTSVNVNNDIGSELSYLLPREQSERFCYLFSALEEHKQMLHVSGFGVSLTTMEEVFIRVGETAAAAAVDVSDRLRVRSSAMYDNVDFHSDTGSDHSASKDSPRLHQNDFTYNNKGLRHFVQQFYALLIKKLLYVRRNRVLTLIQILLPALMVTIVTLVIRMFPGAHNDPPMDLSIQSFSSPVSPVWLTGDPARVRHLRDVIESVTDSGLQVIDPASDLLEFLLQQQQPSIASYNRRYIAAFHFHMTDDVTSDSVTSYFNNAPFHGSAVAMATLDELLLRYYTSNTGYNLTFINHPIPMPNKTRMNLLLMGAGEGLQVSMVTLLAVSFTGASFLFFLIKESSSGFAHLQRVTGTGVVVLRLAHLLLDLLLFTCTGTVVIISYHLLQVETLQTPVVQTASFVLLICYGFVMVSLSYSVTCCFNEPSTGFMFLFVLNLAFGVSGIMLTVILRLPMFNQLDLADNFNSILMLIPNYALAMTSVDLYINSITNGFCSHNAMLSSTCALLQLLPQLPLPNPCCKGVTSCLPIGCVRWTNNIYSYERLGIGKPLLFMLTQGAMLLLINHMYDQRMYRRLFYVLKQILNIEPQRQFNKKDDVTMDTDSEVRAETERVLNDRGDSDVLVLSNLTKIYPGGVVAVDRLCLGVSRGECLGLLGTNGAGKTSTFQMITGATSICWGDVLFRGCSIKFNPTHFFNNIGYCPQFDALPDHMTGRETLWMFARLRGIQEWLIDGVVDNLASALNFKEHLDKLTGQCSGGNRRKLSTAIALVGDPPLVLLDEPTAGMDPVARRMLWDVISRVRARGQSIILTSHSMEECEALCTRIAIMVKGKLQCLGSLQHLKNKYGTGFTLSVKVKAPPTERQQWSTNERQDALTDFELIRLESANSMSLQSESCQMTIVSDARLAVDAVIDYIHRALPGAVLKDVHQNLLEYHVPDSEVTWSQIFRAIEDVKVELEIEDYCVSQTSLEQVFLNFVKLNDTSKDLNA